MACYNIWFKICSTITISLLSLSGLILLYWLIVGFGMLGSKLIEAHANNFTIIKNCLQDDEGWGGRLHVDCLIMGTIINLSLIFCIGFCVVMVCYQTRQEDEEDEMEKAIMKKTIEDYGSIKA